MVYYFHLRILHYGHDPKNWKAIFQRGTCWMYFVSQEKNKDSSMVNIQFIPSPFFHKIWIIWYNHMTKRLWTGSMCLFWHETKDGSYPAPVALPLEQGGTGSQCGSESALTWPVSGRSSSPPWGAIVAIVSLLIRGFHLTM